MRAFPLIVLLAACSRGAEEGGPDAADEGPKTDPRTLVEVASVVRGSVGSHIGASAVIESEAQATLVPETTGIVTGIYAEEGDSVRKGQLLAVIASPMLDAAYERASAELERATVDAATAERLHAQGAIAKSEVDLAARALNAARTAHQEASRTRGFTRLESPIDGTVAARNVRYGELAAGQPAFSVVDLSRLRVVVSLPERDLAKVRPGLPATLTSAYDAEATGAGRVERVAPVVEAASGTFRVTVRLEPTEGEVLPLRPGQFASVRIEVDRHEDVLTVPRRALVWEEGKAYVFEVVETTAEAEAAAAPEKEAEKKEEGFSFPSFSFGEPEEEKKEPELPGPWRKARRVEVGIGYEDGEIAEVLTGVEQGAAVVTVGNQSLRDGARVRLPEDPTLADDKADKDAAAAAETENPPDKATEGAGATGEAG